MDQPQFNNELINRILEFQRWSLDYEGADISAELKAGAQVLEKIASLISGIISTNPYIDNSKLLQGIVTYIQEIFSNNHGLRILFNLFLENPQYKDSVAQNTLVELAQAIRFFHPNSYPNIFEAPSHQEELPIPFFNDSTKSQPTEIEQPLFLTSELIKSILEFRSWQGGGKESDELKAAAFILNQVANLIQENFPINNINLLQQNIAALIKDLLSKDEKLKFAIYNFLTNPKYETFHIKTVFIELAQASSNSDHPEDYLNVFVPNQQEKSDIQPFNDSTKHQQTVTTDSPNNPSSDNSNKILLDIVKRSEANYSLNKWANNSQKNGARILKLISDEIKKYVTYDAKRNQISITPENKKSLLYAIDEIFQNESSQDIWNLLCNESNSEVATALTSLAMFIEGAQSPQAYLQVLMPYVTLNIPASIGQYEFHNNIVLLISENGKLMQLVDLETVKNIYLETGIVTDIQGNKLKEENEQKILTLLKKQYPEVKKMINEATAQFDPIKSGLKQSTIEILYNLGISGDRTAANQADAAKDRVDDDLGYDDTLEAIGKLEKNDPEEYMALMNLLINGKTFKSGLDSVLKQGNCAGSFKRTIARFLYENVEIDPTSQKQLKERYWNSTKANTDDSASFSSKSEHQAVTATTNSDDSNHWQHSSTKINIIKPQTVETNSETTASQLAGIKELIVQHMHNSKQELPEILSELNQTIQDIKNFLANPPYLEKTSRELQNTLFTCLNRLKLYFDKAEKILSIIENNPQIKIAPEILSSLLDNRGLKDLATPLLDYSYNSFVKAFYVDDSTVKETATQLINNIDIVTATINSTKFPDNNQQKFTI